MRAAAALAALLVLLLAPACDGQPAPQAPLAPAEVEVVQGPELGEGESTLRLLVAGDTGLAPEARGSHYGPVLAGMKGVEGAHALVLLGDNAYPCGFRSLDDPAWKQTVDPLLGLGVPIYPVLGNHDWGREMHPRCRFSNPEVQMEKSGTEGYERWVFPGWVYVVETELAEIVLYDSNALAYGFEEGKAVLQGLQKALARPKTRPWRIVAAHHPLHSCGMHGDQPKTTRVRDAVEPLLGNTDLYVGGHDHNLELRRGTGTDPDPKAKILHVTTGSGSKVRQSQSCNHERFKAQAGFGVVEVTKTTLKVEIYCTGSEKPCMQEKLSRPVPPNDP